MLSASTSMLLLWELLSLEEVVVLQCGEWTACTGTRPCAPAGRGIPGSSLNGEEDCSPLKHALLSVEAGCCDDALAEDLVDVCDVGGDWEEEEDEEQQECDSPNKRNAGKRTGVEGLLG